MADATWNAIPGSADFNTASNWTPASVPGESDTAFFGASTIASLTFSQALTAIGSFDFNVGAPAYTFTITADQSLDFFESGILDGSLATFVNHALNGGNRLDFHNSASAGTAAFENHGDLLFFDSATAGGATITNDANALSNKGGIQFQNSSDAGSATITNDGSVQFFDTTSAAGAEIHQQ